MSVSQAPTTEWPATSDRGYKQIVHVVSSNYTVMYEDIEYIQSHLDFSSHNTIVPCKAVPRYALV
jgi:hypothetical protein